MFIVLVGFGILWALYGFNKVHGDDVRLQREKEEREGEDHVEELSEVILQVDERDGKLVKRRVATPSARKMELLHGLDSESDIGSEEEIDRLPSLTQKMPGPNGEPPDMRVDFEFVELGLELKGSKFKILKGVTGSLPAGLNLISELISSVSLKCHVKVVIFNILHCFFSLLKKKIILIILICCILHFFIQFLSKE